MNTENITKKPRISRAKRWTFTFNNAGIGEQATMTQFFDQKKWRYIVGREVAPETGTPHLQGYFEAPSAVAFDYLKKNFETVHFEAARGSAESNRIYCSKDGVYVVSDDDMEPPVNLKMYHSFDLTDDNIIDLTC